jgi:hypothetical protein
MPEATSVGALAVTVGAAAAVAVRAVPFHWFPKRVFTPATEAVPRTSHVVADTHETDERMVLVLPDGAAAVAKDHDVPFQVSATAGPVPVCPTARQKVVPTHDTEFRMSPVVAGASTLGTTFQVVPFHCSMRVPPPAPVFSVPTATQKVEVVQETSFSVLKPDPAAALKFVQFVADTVGGLVMVPAAEAAGGGATPAKTAQRALARKTVRTEVRRMQAPYPDVPDLTPPAE